MNARDLAVHIVASDAYGADEARVLTPEQLHSSRTCCGGTRVETRPTA